MAKKTVIAFVLVSVAWFLLDLILHRGILVGLYQQCASMWRAPDEMKTGLSFLVTMISAACFVAIYARFFARRDLATGMRYGLLFGIGVGVTMGHGSYAVMPIPYYLALGWFLGGVVKGVVSGAIVGAVVRG